MANFEDTVEWTAKGGFDWGGPYDSWLYRRPITINNTSGGVLTNHQILVELTTSNHTYAHSEADGADIRFTTDNGIDALDYWIESWTEDGTSKIWVELDSIPTGEHVCAYIYCGKLGASDAASGDNTFLLYNVSNIQAFWHMDEDSWNGTTDEVIDETEINDGAASGATTTDGKYNRGGTFDGGDYVNCDNDNSLNFTSSDFSIEFWANPSNLSECIPVGRGSYQTDGYYSYLGAGTIYLLIQQAANQDVITATSAYTTGSWQHFILVRDGTTGHIYKNGLDVTTSADTLTDPATSTRNLYLGQSDAGSHRYTGLLDEVRVYDKAISASDALILANNYMDKMGSFYNVRKWTDTAPTNVVGAESVHATGTMALTSEIAWGAKGAFATPTMSLITLIEWDAKGGVVVTAQGAYQDTIEWDAKGEFVPPHVFIFIDLR